MKTGATPTNLAQAMSDLELDDLKLSVITNRGQKVWPGEHHEIFCTDHWRCRFLSPSVDNKSGAAISHTQIIELLNRVQAAGFDFIKIENLYRFDGVLGYSQPQGA
jgi:isocitrate dehydrogenase